MASKQEAVRVIGGILLAALSLSPAMPARSAPDHAAIVIDAATGAVLVANEANHRWFPASLTKLMTLYLAFEEIEARHLDLRESLTVSKHAASQPATELGLGAGESITVEQAILAVILRSANDAAVVLAERIAGSESAFAARMTEASRRLGMTRTLFRNASGLPDAEQVTTARDMAILARAVVRTFPQHYHYFSARNFNYRGIEFRTINGILASYPGADGLKTGFTCGSGYNLVASATRDERRVIAVLLGSRSRKGRSAEIIKLLDDGFAAAAARPVRRQRVDDPPGANEADPPPPVQMPAAGCGFGVAATATTSSLPAPEAAGRLSGWAVILGAFFSRGETKSAIVKARAALSDVGRGGKPVVVPRRWSGVRSYTALLVGLEEKDASAACAGLRSKGLYCQVLSPRHLNDPNAVWR
jgi:D-alanyl-D-alanine carboxypeptidase